MSDLAPHCGVKSLALKGTINSCLQIKGMAVLYSKKEIEIEMIYLKYQNLII